jgi:hypothetical protein
MAHTTASGNASTVPEQSGMQNVQPTEQTAWVGWIAFAGFMMVMLGTFHAIQGLVALFNDQYFLVGKSGLTLSLDFTAWGWIHIIGGIIIAGAGIALFVGKMWARTVGVILAMASAIVNVSFLAAYPIWSAMMIGVDVLVIWAITVHGRELKQ